MCYAAAAEPNAVLIGSPSANAPDCYTDVVYLELPVGKTLIRMSTKHMTPADPNAPKDVLPVDIPVPYGGDAMEAALKYMAGK